MSEVIRLATAADLDELLDVTLKAYQPIRDLDIDFPAATADKDLLKENVTGNATYVLEKDGAIIATITIIFPWAREETPSRYPFVWWFAVHPDYKNQGVGSKLLNYVEETILRDTLKAPAVTLGTSGRKHPWLADMYKRRGYEVYYERERNGDLSVMLRKVLIPERFVESLLGLPSWA